MKRYISLIILLGILTGIAEGKVKVKGWVSGALGDGMFGLPACYYIGIGKFAMGFPPPFGFGIGISTCPLFSEFFHSFFPRRNIMSYFPLYLYYLPYANWDKEGKPLPVIYSYFLLNNWWNYGESEDYLGDGSYLKLAIGAAWQIHYFSTGLESGFYSFRFKYGNRSFSSFYLGVKLTLGGWVGLGVKKI